MTMIDGHTQSAISPQLPKQNSIPLDQMKAKVMQIQDINQYPHYLAIVMVSMDTAYLNECLICLYLQTAISPQVLKQYPSPMDQSGANDM